MRTPKNPVLSISGILYTKLKYMASQFETEVGYMGIIDDNILLDAWMPKQECSAASVNFDMEDYQKQVAILTDDPWDYHPNSLSRIWIHTHPGNSATPSSTDEDTFKDDFHSDWRIMLIFAAQQDEYCRIATETVTGVKLQQVIPIEVDWDLLDHNLINGNEPADWLEEADQKVEQQILPTRWSYSKKKHIKSSLNSAPYYRGLDSDYEQAREMLSDGEITPKEFDDFTDLYY